MAQKLNLTPEMEEALRKANMPEEKIAELRDMEIGARELSPDDLDGVSGGGGHYAASGNPHGSPPEDWRCPLYWNMTYSELGAYLDGMYKSYGANAFAKDMVINFCNQFFFVSQDWARQFNPPDLDAYYCAEYMFTLMYDGS